MARGISVHVVDVTRGLPAAGMRVEIFTLEPARVRIAAGRLNATGALETEVREIGVGTYEAVFHVGDYYRTLGLTLPEPPFLEEVPFRFGIADSSQHYHLPLKLSPWGFSLFRGS